MSRDPQTVEEYLAAVPADRRAALVAVRDAVREGLPEGYAEGIQYGMIGWFVPHEVYAPGYHANPAQPVPFASLASQKAHISLYLMCIYSDERHRAWFERECRRRGAKVSMGKSCVRFKRLEDLPLDVVTEAVARVPVERFLARYEAALAGRGGASRKASRSTKAAKANVATRRSRQT